MYYKRNKKNIIYAKFYYKQSYYTQYQLTFLRFLNTEILLLLCYPILIIFQKYIPICTTTNIHIFDIKEGKVLSDNIQVGRRSVPALRVEE